MMGTAASPAPTSDRPAAGSDKPAAGTIAPIEGPVWIAWREGTLTRAEELAALCSWVRAKNSRKGGWIRAKNSRKNDEARENDEVLASAIGLHLEAARQAARADKLNPKRWFLIFRIFRNGPLIERAMSNLDAAEAHLLNLAPADYIYGQMPCLLRHVRCHLPPTDPARQEFERIAQRLGIKDPDHPLAQNPKGPTLAEKEEIVEAERGKIVTTVRAASSAALREQIRLRSFRNVVVVTSLAMALLAIGVAITGLLRPTLIPLCFSPQEAGKKRQSCAQPPSLYRSFPPVSLNRRAYQQTILTLSSS
jgi:hypothetical protein